MMKIDFVCTVPGMTVEQERDQLREQVTLLRDRIKDALWDETWWRVEATKALAATEPAK